MKKIEEEVFSEYKTYELNKLPESHESYFEGCGYDSDNTVVYICDTTGWYFTYDKESKEYHTIIFRDEFIRSDLNDMIKVMRENYDG